MKTIMKGAIREEKGNVLIFVLILLVVGGLILTPLLGLMSTGLVSGQVYEEQMDEYYAADAGVEDAIWKITYDPPTSYPCSYPDPQEPPWLVNDKSVDVIIEVEDIDPTCEEELRYRILSTATNDDGSSTTIDAYLSVSYMDFSDLLDYAIVSDGGITIQPGNVVDGNVYLPDEDDLTLKPEGTEISEVIYGEVVDENDGLLMTWPEAGDLSGYYLEDVGGAPDPGDSINIKDLNPKNIGPCYREGSLNIDNTGDPATLVLEGTVYVTGDLAFEQAGSNNYTVDLHGQTIFAEGSIDFPSNVVSISGSGCIIAVGDIDFQPSIASGADDFVLVMSITGEVNFQPSGDFTGCIAGNAHVQLQPGCTINWISPEGKGLDFPMGVGDINELPPVTGLSILSWQIK